MSQQLTQEERLDRLVEEFKADSGDYKDIETPKDTEGKRQILRSLMNIRMPRDISSDVLRIQDEYLKGRSEEKGIITLSDIPEIKNGLSIWHGLRTADRGSHDYRWIQSACKKGHSHRGTDRTV